MNTTSRQRRAQVRDITRELRAARRAVKAVNSGLPQSAKTHLVASGIDTATATRFAPAFSRSVTPTSTTTGKVKLTKRSRKTKTVQVKTYSQATFAARLRVYRPKDTTAAVLFERAAFVLAA
jgi:hypothetical protein